MRQKHVDLMSDKTPPQRARKLESRACAAVAGSAGISLGGVMNLRAAMANLRAFAQPCHAFSSEHAIAYVDGKISVRIRKFLIASPGVDVGSFDVWAAANLGWPNRLKGALLGSTIFTASLDDLGLRNRRDGHMKRWVAMSARAWRGIPIAAALAVAVLPSAHAKSPKEVFAGLSGGIVALLALDSRGRAVGRGSGVIVGENHVATDCHVVSGATRIDVRRAANAHGPEPARMLARLTAREPRGLCLLFVARLSDPPPASSVPLGPRPRRGDRRRGLRHRRRERHRPVTVPRHCLALAPR